jgi:hypothetical protein
MQPGTFVACLEGLNDIILLHVKQNLSSVEVSVRGRCSAKRAELPSSLAVANVEGHGCTEVLLHVVGGPVLVGLPPWHLETFSQAGLLLRSYPVELPQTLLTVIIRAATSAAYSFYQGCCKRCLQ